MKKILVTILALLTTVSVLAQAGLSQGEALASVRTKDLLQTAKPIIM